MHTLSISYYCMTGTENAHMAVYAYARMSTACSVTCVHALTGVFINVDWRVDKYMLMT
jgi:hypothetical protein